MNDNHPLDSEPIVPVAKRYRIRAMFPFGNNEYRTRVVEIPVGESVPDDAVLVADNEPLTDWVKETK